VRVLIAEDEQVSRHLLEILMEEWGYEAVICEDGLQAWEAMQKADAPQLGIFDWMMPGIDGLELCRRVRQRSDARPTYILFLTAKAQESDIVQGLKAGGDDFVTKPFDQEVLRARLQVGERVLALQERVLEQEQTARQRAEWIAAEKTQALEEANRQLKEQQAQLVQSERLAALGQMAAGIAHELNNPIGFVFNNLTTLDEYVTSLSQYVQEYKKLAEAGRQGSNQKEQAWERIATLARQEDLEYILNDAGPLLQESRDGAERVRRIAKELRDFSRSDAGEWLEADVNKEIETALKFAAPALAEKAQVETQLGELPLLVCCPGQLNQVFTNLLTNAAQAISAEGVVRVFSAVQEGHIHIEVRDTGSGIPGDQLEDIFEAFYTTKKAGQGTGLGLSISKAIVEKHKGSLKVQSEVGRGTCFTIRLPLGGAALGAV